MSNWHPWSQLNSKKITLDAGDGIYLFDDLGTEFANSFTTSQFFMCINERLLRKKATIISSNLDLNQLAEIYSERTFSRIALHYEVLKLFGDDIRLHLRFGKN